MKVTFNKVYLNSDHTNLLMVQFTKEHGRMDKDTEEVNNYGLMVASMKVIGLIIWQTEKDV